MQLAGRTALGIEALDAVLGVRCDPSGRPRRSEHLSEGAR